MNVNKVNDTSKGKDPKGKNCVKIKAHTRKGKNGKIINVKEQTRCGKKGANPTINPRTPLKNILRDLNKIDMPATNENIAKSAAFDIKQLSEQDAILSNAIRRIEDKLNVNKKSKDLKNALAVRKQNKKKIFNQIKDLVGIVNKYG